MLKKVATGIAGLDTITKGGIPEKDLILVSGSSGTGKTILGLQFLYASKDRGIFVSFEEPLAQIKTTALGFGWDLDKIDRIRLLKYDPFKIEDIFEVIENNIKETDARRVVIDSISALGIYVKDPGDLRRMILQVSSMLRKNDCTSLLISEVMNVNRLSRFGMEEFVTDGVIVMRNVFVNGEYRRGINVWKLRGSDHSRKVHSYKITDKGIVVYPNEIIK